jgi:hypothetical protein
MEAPMNRPAIKVKVALAALILGSAGAAAGEAEARSKPPLRNPALLNIGFVCRWQPRCIRTQEKAMVRSLNHMRTYPPAPWKVQLCNRNSSRNGTRKDWVGFENCLRNPTLRPPAKSRRKRTA